MSDTKKRTVSDIQNEYSGLCARAGHLQYSIYALSLDLDMVNEQLKELNIEGATAQKAEAEAAKTAALVAAESTPTEGSSS